MRIEPVTKGEFSVQYLKDDIFDKPNCWGFVIRYFDIKVGTMKMIIAPADTEQRQIVWLLLGAQEKRMENPNFQPKYS